MPKVENPYTPKEVTCYVQYQDENGSWSTFSVQAQSIDSAIERLGGVERKLEALKKASNVNKS